MKVNSSKLFVVTLAGALLTTHPVTANAIESNTIEFNWSTVIGECANVMNSSDSIISRNSREEFLVKTSTVEEFLAQSKKFDEAQIKLGEHLQLEERPAKTQVDFSTTEGIQNYETARKEENKKEMAMSQMPEISTTIISTAVTSKEEEVAKTDSSSEYIMDVSENEITWLRRIVAAEAGNQEYEGKVAVAEVVLNRVLSSRFKQNDIVSVICAKNQFQPVSNGTVYTAYGKMPEDIQNEIDKAVDEALRGSNYSEGALFFRTKHFFSNHTKIKKIGAHYFSK